tara:strand:+ start:117 stop:323 length:207 start_codon:yes stop_codon:yes gene_type:complete
MIRLEIKNGVQKITEICDKCKCHVKDLTVDDILVKGNTDAIIKNSKGEEVTRKTHDHMTCKCEHCNHD